MNEPEVVTAPKPIDVQAVSAGKLQAEVAKEFQKNYVAQFYKYLADGTMPHSFYTRLPAGLQKAYRDRFRHRPDHAKGRPLTAAEHEAAVKQDRKNKQKKRQAKQARKQNR